MKVHTQVSVEIGNSEGKKLVSKGRPRYIQPRPLTRPALAGLECITSFSYFLERQNPDFYSIFQLPIFVERYHQTYVHQCLALITRLKHAISPYSGIVWVLFYNI